MLRLQTTMTSVAVLLLFSAALPTAAVAKCSSVRIVLRGNISGGVADKISLAINVSSTTSKDPVSTVRQHTVVKGSQFQIIGWFNTVSSLIRDETCDRTPRNVLLVISDRKGVALQRKSFDIDRDFRKTRDGGFEITRPIDIQLPRSEQTLP